MSAPMSDEDRQYLQQMTGAAPARPTPTRGTGADVAGMDHSVHGDRGSGDGGELHRVGGDRPPGSSSVLNDDQTPDNGERPVGRPP